MLFFRKEKPKPKKTKVKAADLDEQYQNLLGDYLNDFEAEATNVMKEIAASKNEILPLLEKLKNAELRNENIPPKERHFMEGNRLSYIKAVNAFLSKLNEPDEISDSTAKIFLAEYEEVSEDFRKSSMRPGQITNHFFGDIMKHITEQLVAIDKCSKGLFALMKSDSMKAVAETRSKISLIQSEIEKNETLLKELEESEKGYEDIRRERAVFERRVISIKKNSTFLQLAEFNSLLKKTEEEMKMLDAEFIDNFLQIEKALKKFSKSDDDALISQYIEDPVTAVINDPDLRIVEILNKASEALRSGALEIEDKKKEKLVEKMASLDKEKFTKFVIAHNDLTLKISDINRRMKQNNSQRELDDAKYKLEHVQKKQQNVADSIKKINNQIEALKIADLKYDIEKAFESLNVPIEIEICEEDEKERG